MGGAFSIGGLISGLDTNTLIAQLIQLERRPLFRLQSRIQTLKDQKDTIKELRTQLLTFRNVLKDLQFGLEFGKFGAVSSTESVLTAEQTGPNPTSGSFLVDVIQLASATIAVSGSRLASLPRSRPDP